MRGRYVDLVLVDGGRAPAEVAAETGRAARGRRRRRAGRLPHQRRAPRRRAGRWPAGAPYVFTPPHEGGRRPAGVRAAPGVDPRASTRPRWPGWSRHRRGRAAGRCSAPTTSGRRRSTGHARRAGRRRRWRGGRARPRCRSAGRGRDPGRLLDDLRGAPAPTRVLLSLVGRDLVAFNREFATRGLDRRVVRLSGALEENGLSRSAATRPASSSPACPRSRGPLRRRAAARRSQERHRGLFGAAAPVVCAYAARRVRRRPAGRRARRRARRPAPRRGARPAGPRRRARRRERAAALHLSSRRTRLGFDARGRILPSGN